MVMVITPAPDTLMLATYVELMVFAMPAVPLPSGKAVPEILYSATAAFAADAMLTPSVTFALIV